MFNGLKKRFIVKMAAYFHFLCSNKEDFGHSYKFFDLTCRKEECGQPHNLTNIENCRKVIFIKKWIFSFLSAISTDLELHFSYRPKTFLLLLLHLHWKGRPSNILTGNKLKTLYYGINFYERYLLSIHYLEIYWLRQVKNTNYL